MFSFLFLLYESQDMELLISIGVTTWFWFPGSFWLNGKKIGKIGGSRNFTEFQKKIISLNFYHNNAHSDQISWLNIDVLEFLRLVQVFAQFYIYTCPVRYPFYSLISGDLENQNTVLCYFWQHTMKTNNNCKLSYFQRQFCSYI